MTIRARAAAFAAFALLMAEAASAQAPKKGPLTFGAELNVMAVPVFVTDKDGKAVSGLTLADFELQDAGKPAAIEGFVSVGADAELPPSSEVAAASMRRQFLFLFDLDFSRPHNLERARKAAQNFVRQLNAPDLVAVGVMHPSGFRALLGFTPDKQQAAAAIAELGLGGAGRVRDPLALVYNAALGVADREPAADQTDRASRQDVIAEELRDQAIQLNKSERERITRHVEQFLAGFRGLARTLDSVKGRKQIILFSEGFDTSAITGVTGVNRQQNAAAVSEGRLWEVDSEGHFGSTTGQTAMTDLFNALRGADVVVHSVDVKGLGETMNLQAQEGDEPLSIGRNSLAEFSQNSGGRFLRSANNIDRALQEVLALNQHFYVLAFSPQSADRGKSRKLSIKVKRPGLSLSYRASYTLPDPKKLDPARTAAESSEIIAKGISGGPIRLTAYALPYRAKDGAAALPVVVQISPDAVADVAKRKQVGLQIFGYLVDGKGVVQDYFQATPTLDPTQTAEPLKRAGLQLITTFAASPGASEVRILVRDPAAATWGALRVPVEIPDFSASQKGFISNPMIVDDPFSRLALPTTTQRRPNREIPFRLDDRAFTVESDPVLKRGTAREVCVYLAPATGSTPSFEVSLVAASGSKVAQRPEKARVVRDADGFDRLVFFISPQGVEPGDYALSVTAGGQTASFPVRIQ